MAAPKNNEFWKLRSKHGRDKLFKSPALLWGAACEYFQWCQDNPLLEEKGFAYQGIVTKETFNKMRAMTMEGLCFYLHCNQAYFRQFKDSLPKDEEDFSTIIIDIEKTVYRQKFEGAAADLLNANLIARDLGLKDRADITSDDKRIEPITGIRIIRDGT
jgi:DNA-packaging protein gp3